MEKTNAKLYFGFMESTAGEIIPLNITNVKDNLTILDINEVASNLLDTNCIISSNNLPVDYIDYIYYLKTTAEVTEF